ncbi:ankyrin repeat domain-containing protein [Akkermansia muciniphila]|uniref:ankyrin repeat domain-containing protein n=1 Tax=Akkermansia muciniphila TaxID=239935 RepID=UPI001EDE7B50|nr:ankyrin repeat domain-containing protein [Akkermansia muciniphila]MCG4694411.1 ankyrin repeat domain-containing protein [Akkermansia muciniphila]MCQ5040948.1 ankyrin repeat domain-containing protein [Akkermansia muciniphila]
MSDTVKDYFRNKEASQLSNKGGKTSSLSASKQNQNQKKLERLLEKSAREAERLIKKYKIDVNQEVSFVPFGSSQAISTFPTVIAAETGNVPMMELLINNGASLDVKMEKSYVMPKHYSAVLVAAAESGSIPMVKLLLKHIPDTDYQRLGATYIAARNGDLPMLRFLKEQGIPFYSGCLEGVSHECNVSQGCRSKQKNGCIHLTVMKYLLENGCDIKKDRAGSLAWACSKGNEAMVRLLLEHGAECDIHTAGICPASGSAIVKAGAGGTVNIIKMLLAKGANIHDTRKDDGKHNALHNASLYGNDSVIPFLIRAGLDVNSPDSAGRTPLMLAAQRGELNAVKTLLAEGADAAITDHKGKTAADHARESSNYAGSTQKGKNGKEYFLLDGSYINKTGAEEIYRLLSKTR